MQMTGHIPLSISLAITWAAPQSFAAMAEAPQPLPTSRTVFPWHSSGLSKRYLNADVASFKNRHSPPNGTVQLPRQRLSSWPVYGPVRVIKRPKFRSFSPKTTIWGKQVQFDLGCQAELPSCLCVLQNKSPDGLIRLKSRLFKPFNKCFKTLTVSLWRKSSQHNFVSGKTFQASFDFCASHIVIKQFLDENNKHLHFPPANDKHLNVRV